jgi:hypothetical protein
MQVLRTMVRQTSDPISDHWPSSQLPHAEPAAGANLPTAQNTQSAMDSLAAPGAMDLPAGQLVQDSCFATEKVPGAQLLHIEPGGANLPAVQGTQSAMDLPAPGADDVPAGHS